MSRRGFGREGNGAVGVAENILGNLGPIFTLKNQAKYMTGARAVIKVNDKLFGFAFSVSWNVSLSAVEINTIDDPTPWELAPQRISVSGSMSAFILPGQSVQSELIMADIGSFLANRYITIEVKDSATDEIIFKTSKAMITGQSASLQSEQLGQQSLTWKAVGWQVETPPKAFSVSDLNGNGDLPDALGVIKNVGSAIAKKLFN